MSIKINNPGAIVIIYNYRDRLGDVQLSADIKEATKIDQIILNSASLKNVSTQKSKSNPAGSFEFRLAPTKNWVTAITPGSWCVILMSNSGLNDAAKYGNNLSGGSDTVDQKSFKMMGRIESVRGVASVNQSNGARETEYIVTGSDWGVIFNSVLYVDPIDRTPGLGAAPVGMAERFGYLQYIEKWVSYEASTLGGTTERTLKSGVAGAAAIANIDSGSIPMARPTVAPPVAVVAIIPMARPAEVIPMARPAEVITPTIKPTAGQVAKDKAVTLPNARLNVDFILGLWGRSDPLTSGIEAEINIVAKSQQVFTIPNKLRKYMGFVDKAKKPSTAISQILYQRSGRLTSLDKYEDKDFSCGIVDMNSILGEHSLWQLLSSNSNSLINELIPEIRFPSTGTGSAELTLYNRVRPFTINSNTMSKDLDKVGDDLESYDNLEPFISRFKNVKRITIDPSDVMLCSYGTNWRDRVNFIEVTIARTLFQESWAQDIKLQSQFVDELSIGRDGILPMLKSTTYVPSDGKGLADPLGVSAYKYPLKEWYFNTHKMLNGTLNLIGQDQYIQVGDNIIVESKVLNRDYNINYAQSPSNSPKSYLLAHVESISHQTIVDNNGGRIFTTSINFVRGIITNSAGDIIVGGGATGGVDQNAALVSSSREQNSEVLATSSELDPDRNRYPNIKDLDTSE